ncbi:hypothetical protein KUV50_07435 [Membranicola marinus]|uniref:Uncharacterized protein n=1 Tax=Membranihabitans marinus TaxID=1227546 RepID=A0A953HTB5_9BACT|nr:hypothetical protein [Membranihabitans marinus]MBY5957955.1 hypothetical protein [Membranihabitans marinus]
MSDTNTHTSRKRQREAQCLEPDIPLKCQTLSMLTPPTANVLHEHAHEPETPAGNAVSGTWTASGVRHLQGKLAGSAVSGTWSAPGVRHLPETPAGSAVSGT